MNEYHLIESFGMNTVSYDSCVSSWIEDHTSECPSEPSWRLFHWVPCWTTHLQTIEYSAVKANVLNEVSLHPGISLPRCHSWSHKTRQRPQKSPLNLDPMFTLTQSSCLSDPLSLLDHGMLFYEGFEWICVFFFSLNIDDLFCLYENIYFPLFSILFTVW